MIILNPLLKYYHTLKYLKLRQTFGRQAAQIKKRFHLFRIPSVPVSLSGKTIFRSDFLFHDPWNNVEDIKSGKFNFLNRVEQFDLPISWNYSHLPLLWSYNLHYFNYLHLLTKEEQVKICHSWIDKNNIGEGVGWSPYPLSLRIVNWSKANFNDERILESLFLQAAYLFRNLEFYHPGNHYLENAKAMVFVGLFFNRTPESENWFQKGKKIIEKEISIQFLPDGGYFERTQMYHAIMLHGLIDLINILPETDSLYSSLKSTVENALDFQISNTHPDGTIALFNDSTLEIAPSTEQLVEYSSKLIGYSPKIKSQFTDSGYFITRHDDLYLIVDGGDIGPDFLPAHSHADIFSYEISIKGQKVIVDSGVYDYAQGEMRSYTRSTTAHNTVSVDGVDQAECWGSFRVARRYKPKNVSFSIDNNFSFFEGCFEGFAHLIGDSIIHVRTIISNYEKRMIRIKDSITGTGAHNVESYIHITPEIELLFDGKNKIIAGSAKIVVLSDADIQINKSFYCPQFGVKKENKMIALRKNSKLPATIEYEINY